MNEESAPRERKWYIVHTYSGFEDRVKETLRQRAEAMGMGDAFGDVRIPTERHNDIHVLLALINEKMWLGHFDLWTDEGLPMYRHAIPLRGTSGLAPEQLNDLVEVAISESERFYPAFQYVVWAGKTPADALTASILETVGEA